MSVSDEPNLGVHAAEDHHAELWAELIQRTHALLEVVAAAADPEPSRRELVDYLNAEVVPHLRTEERVVYNLARGAGQHTLVAALELDHRALLRQVKYLGEAVTGLDAALAARVVLLLFALRMEKEERVLMPALAEADVDVTELLQGRQEMVGSHTIRSPREPGPAGHGHRADGRPRPSTMRTPRHGEARGGPGTDEVAGTI